MLCTLIPGVEVGLDSPTYDFEEDGGRVSVCVQLQSGLPQRLVMVTFLITSGEGTASACVFITVFMT